MSDQGWDDLDDLDEIAPAPPTIVERVPWDDVARSLSGVAPDSEGQPVADETSASDESDGLTLFGDPDQFHVAWQHWNGMPEFHMDDLRPHSEVVVKFRTPEAREEFARLLGREIRKEEPRGIWFPKIEIAHFWDKRYRDENETSVAVTPDLTEADERDETETEETA